MRFLWLNAVKEILMRFLWFHTVEYKNHSVGHIFHSVKYKSRTVKQRIC